MNEQTIVQELARLRNKMDTTRTVITPVVENEEITKLSLRAADKLGYGLLMDRYELRNALAKLEIEILDKDVVEQYMKLAQRLKNGWRFWEPWHWHTQLVSSFIKPIPEFVLNKALQIKEELPRVQICVCALVKNDDESFYPDPFLIATTDRWSRREFYYVEVWDENIFEGRLRPKEKDGKQV